MYQQFSSSPSLQMTFFVFPGGPLSLVSKIKDSKDNNSAVSGHNEIPPMLEMRCTQLNMGMFVYFQHSFPGLTTTELWEGLQSTIFRWGPKSQVGWLQKDWT